MMVSAKWKVSRIFNPQFATQWKNIRKKIKVGGAACLEGTLVAFDDSQEKLQTQLFFYLQTIQLNMQHLDWAEAMCKGTSFVPSRSIPWLALIFCNLEENWRGKKCLTTVSVSKGQSSEEATAQECEKRQWNRSLSSQMIYLSRDEVFSEVFSLTNT